MKTNFLLLDVVATTKVFSEYNLHSGQVGTIVEVLASGVYEVEFADVNGQTIASCPIKESDLIQLHYDALKAA